MNPTDVNQAQFPVHKVLYNDGEFSVVWGTWDPKEGGDNGLGMRWNQSPKEPGFPTGFGNRPIWLVIPTSLSIPFVTSLIGKQSADNDALLQVLRELEANGSMIPPASTSMA